jgi:serine O-acetyltransferase
MNLLSPEPVRDITSTVWTSIRASGEQWAEREPMMSGWLTHCVLGARNFAYSLAVVLTDKLADSVLPQQVLMPLVLEAIADDPMIAEAAAADLDAQYTRNPACPDHLTAFLFFKGYHAVEAHRVAHWFWQKDRRTLAYYLQSRGSEVFGVDIHPAAPFGRGIFFDHATGIVVGETAAIDDDVSLLQGVTLGGTGKECGDRHPKVRSGVMISAGARVLGNIVIGEGAKVGANSVVLNNVPPHTTVVGVPARVVGAPVAPKPSLVMDQSLDVDGFDPGI